MAQIITLNDSRNYPDKVLALGEKELLQYSIGNREWNELHVTLVHDLITSSGVVVRADAERLSIAEDTNSSLAVNRAHFGLKSDAEDWVEDSYSIYCVNAQQMNNQLRMALSGSASVLVRGPVVGNVEGTMTSGFSPSMCSRDQHSGITRLRFNVLNRGTPTQRIQIDGRSATLGTQPGITYPAGVLTKEILSAYKATNLSAAGSVGSAPWLLTNGDPAPIPNTFYVYWPFAKTRLCICGILIEKIS